MLAIEIDGSVHLGHEPQDAARTAELECWGWTVLRFTNDAVERKLQAVLEQILATLNELPLAAGHRSHPGSDSTNEPSKLPSP
jgi:very-short-patch-repair endonuclease